MPSAKGFYASTWLEIRESQEKGQFTSEWKQREHELRVYAASKPLSYRAFSEVASAGAQLHVKGLKKEMMSIRGTVPVQYCLLQTKPFSRRFSYFTWLEPVFSSLQL